MGAELSKDGGPTAGSGSRACEDCRKKFNPFTRRKRVCIECHCLICNDCSLANFKRASEISADSSASSSRSSDRHEGGATDATLAAVIVNCQNCSILLSSDPTHDSLMKLHVKTLKSFLIRHRVPEVDSCVEKRHLVDLILERYGGVTYQQYVQRMCEQRDLLTESFQNNVQPLETDSSTPEDGYSTRQQQQQTRSELSRAEHRAASPEAPPVTRQPEPPADDSKSKISLNELESKEEINNLTVKQLKIILTHNFVDYRGCKEKHELITKVKMLWDSRQANKKLYEKLLNPPDGKGVPGSLEEPDLCKICMDAPIDCVLLECGHMVTCTQCGKQMNECPICRQFVLRAVHVFRT